MKSEISGEQGVTPFFLPLMKDCEMPFHLSYFLFVELIVPPAEAAGQATRIPLTGGGSVMSNIPFRSRFEITELERKVRTYYNQVFPNGRGQSQHQVLSHERIHVWLTGRTFARDGNFMTGYVGFGLICPSRDVRPVAEAALARAHYFYEIGRAVTDWGTHMLPK